MSDKMSNKNEIMLTYWESTGNLKSRCFYNSNGKIDGLYEQWYPNGELHILRYFEDGIEIEKEYKEWKQNGNIRSIKMITTEYI